MSTPITASLVKELRDRTGAGMGDCKKALEAVGGDIEKAAEKLRIDGMAKADKKGSRTAAEGVIATASSDEAVALVEVNCETDFVAKGDDFKALGETAAKLALKHRPATVEALLALKDGEQTLEELRRVFVAKAGENTTIRRFEVVEKSGGAIAQYLHGARIGVVVALSAGDADLAKDIAMHVAASSPRYLDAAAVPADVIDAERKIIEAQSAEQAAGKPADIVAKMLEGKVRKFLSEITLVGQPFVKDPDQTVEKLLKSKNAGVARFVRLAVGEGIEKKQVDFAAEVAAATQV
ncbi:elongation factor Ts [Hydrocarboniphaga daqingensis]|jgi:elongation factor Ts|uniref:Elongation factor Ts n=1 Tax=Hydrocarboniphaga daqingensis TaxID=490188 RepID=A0A1M5Q2P3_9GAMM|nr:translation elongation factor Ts [Hydrocarboniphaga daqingensis]SHH08176.1 elongation factor Ts [Hydrocarboniphaga daqingensis]